MNLDLWVVLESEALWQLEHPDQLPPREDTNGMALLLRHWRYPRSGEHVSWSALLPVRDYRSRRAVIREVVWDRLADWKRRNDELGALKRRPGFPASVRVRDAELSWDELSPHLDALGALRTPPGPAVPAPSKEDAFGFQGHRSLAHVRLRWSGKGPRSWAESLSRIACRALPAPQAQQCHDKGLLYDLTRKLVRVGRLEFALDPASAADFNFTDVRQGRDARAGAPDGARA
jgi:hypothetical protein